MRDLLVLFLIVSISCVTVADVKNDGVTTKPVHVDEADLRIPFILSANEIQMSYHGESTTKA
uniref:SFRICE_007227 n=1 Tax=Spodoptera frugiperda TaxID=7108 RepID=A0A2H1VHK4_SPOFR